MLFSEMPLACGGYIHNKPLRFTEKGENVICDKYLNICTLLHSKWYKFLSKQPLRPFFGRLFEEHLDSCLFIWKVTMEKEDKQKESIQVFERAWWFLVNQAPVLLSWWGGKVYSTGSTIEVRVTESKQEQERQTREGCYLGYV